MSASLKIVADAHIWAVESACSALPGYDVQLQLLEHSRITTEQVRDADILLTRSSTRVDAALLEGSRVRFAATATIGDDHYDKAWLDAQQISWANAAGSSTDSVIEYMLTALLELHTRDLIDIPATTIGIVGAGRIGGKLAGICKRIGMNVLCNDPPRARCEGPDSFDSLDTLLERADILSLHTPLLRSGPDCTAHLLGGVQFDRFRGRGVINAGRGACVDNRALRTWLDGDERRFAALDCWEHEPRPDIELLSHPGMAIATPHIAGHSLDGKAANTLFIYRALCTFLAIEPVWDLQAELPPPPAVRCIDEHGDCWQQLHAACSRLYPLHEDDESMKSWSALSTAEFAHAFSGYRRHYPVRRSWQHAPIHFRHADTQTQQLAAQIGIRCV